MNNNVVMLIFYVSLFLGVLVCSILNVIRKYRYSYINKRHVNEESYQNYAKFYGNTVPSDEEFNNKLRVIYKLITKDNEMNIKKIARNSNCTLEECVLKIKYLKNKRLLGDYYIDTSNMKLLPCSLEDQKLLDKYKPYVYGSHLQINEIANMVTNKGYKNINELRNEVYNELNYLDDKGLLNGIKIDDVDRIIIYYTIEKRKNISNYESVHCPNCGAINDVLVSGKVRCGYCKTIVKGSGYEENI